MELVVLCYRAPFFVEIEGDQFTVNFCLERRKRKQQKIHLFVMVYDTPRD